MALDPNFPANLDAILDPAIRWFPADESLRETAMAKLMPPLVATLRLRVKEFRLQTAFRKPPKGRNSNEAV